MNKIGLFLMLFFTVFYGASNAQCDYTDDFITVSTLQQNSFADSYVVTATTTTTGGWEFKNFLVVRNEGGNSTTLNQFKALEAGEIGIAIIGSTAKTGYILSPVLANGCDSLSFNYAARSSNQNRRFRMEIIQNGVTVFSSDTTLIMPEAAGTKYTYGQKIGITGNYQIKITNLCPQGMTGMRDEITIWNFCIVSTSAMPPAIALSGIPKAEGGFWDKANVTLTSGSDIYYTTDNTEPTDASTPYTAPFNITQTTRLKTVTVKSGASSAMLDTLITVTASPYKITAPENATVFVGVPTGSGYNYRPFTEKTATYSTLEDGKKTYYYNVSGKHNYRVSRADAVTTVGVFTPSGTATSLEITEAQLTSHAPKEIDHDVNKLNGRNVADIFVNINAAGHLYLPKIDTTFQIVNQRNWQTIDNDVNNYFFQPDFHYTVLGENGAPSNAVLTVSPTGLITPVGEGTAIVLITYDALLCTHTTNVGNNGNAFFSVLWPENTAVFVVTVGEKGAGITSNMTVSEYWNSDGTDKTDGITLDSEHDVLYYEASTGGFDYTFKPEGVLDVTLATPTYATVQTPNLGVRTMQFTGFSQDGVTKHTDGSYTVHLTEGRNIVQLISASNYKSEFQVITAKPVTWTVSNVTQPGETPAPGDSISVAFSTLYHPANKMAGIYNMSAGIQYSIQATNFQLILSANQYTFASRAQAYGYRIPAGYAGDDITLTKGVIKTTGYGSTYGSHRFISLVAGVQPNLNASVRQSYLGSIPDVRIHTVGVPPSVPGNLQTLGITDNSMVLKWTASTDNVGVEGYTIWADGDSLTTVSQSTLTFPVTGLTALTAYTFEVAAFDASGHYSAKALATATTLPGGTGINDLNANVISIYPNPFVDYIIIHATENGTATIYDLSGKAVLTTTLINGSNRIATSALPRGLYVLKTGEKVVRIVK